MTWLGLVRISHSCQILSVDGACLSLATFVVSTPIKTILELFRRAFEILPKTGDRPRQTWLRTVEDDLRPLNFGLRWQASAFLIDRHGVNSRRWPRLRDMPRRETEWPNGDQKYGHRDKIWYICGPQLQAYIHRPPFFNDYTPRSEQPEQVHPCFVNLNKCQ